MATENKAGANPCPTWNSRDQFRALKPQEEGREGRVYGNAKYYGWMPFDAGLIILHPLSPSLSAFFFLW